MREAFAHATLGDAAACHAAIGDAHTHLERISIADEDPNWVGYFGEAKLVADTGIALSQLGEPLNAQPFIEQGLARQETANIRTRAFHSFWLVTTQLSAGALDEACAAAGNAVELASSVDSVRITRHLSEFRVRLDAYRTEPTAKELQERIGEFLRRDRL